MIKILITQRAADAIALVALLVTFATIAIVGLLL